FRVRVRVRRSHRRVDDVDSFAAEDLVEGGGELAVAIVDQEAHPLQQAREAEVARLLDDPGSCRLGCATSEMDAPAAELDEEEHIQATQRHGLHGEEIAGNHAHGLLAKEYMPARRSAPRRRLEPSGGKDRKS